MQGELSRYGEWPQLAVVLGTPSSTGKVTTYWGCIIRQCGTSARVRRYNLPVDLHSYRIAYS